MRSAILLLLGVSMACHRHGNATSAVPSYPIDGAYRFLIDVPGVHMTGRFVVADTQVYLDVDADLRVRRRAEILRRHAIDVVRLQPHDETALSSSFASARSIR